MVDQNVAEDAIEPSYDAVLGFPIPFMPKRVEGCLLKQVIGQGFIGYMATQKLTEEDSATGQHVDHSLIDDLISIGFISFFGFHGMKVTTFRERPEIASP